MDERLQQVFDHELDRSALTSSERAELREAESTFAAVLRAVPVDPLPALAPAVLRRIHERQAGLTKRGATVGATVGAMPAPRRRVARWLWQPRAISITWRPAYALAAAVVLAVLVSAESWRFGSGAPPVTHQVFTQFVLRAPDATTVALAGDFTGWKPAYAMTRSEPGVWTVVVPLDPGVHSYSFVVDGVRWVPDPMAPAFDDGFGGANSRVAVLTPDERRS